jgi:replication initiation protein RepC
MQTHISTTPFGRRSVTLGMIASQVTAKSASEGATVDKWKVFYSIRDAKEMLGATDRALTVLNALLSFHLEPKLSADGELVVWPSNEALTARANGMPPSTLRRHLANLVECGLIIRRDSPNGKRFARKGRGGEIEQAYGFDLSPIVARAEEFQNLAEAMRAEKKAFQVSRERLTLLRRDIVKLIDAGIEENVPGDWAGVLRTYQAIVGRLPRSAPRQLIDDVSTDLHGLYTEIREVLESFANSQNPSANESHSERHKQNSNPDPLRESENGLGNKKEAGGTTAEPDNLRSLPKRELPLGIVLDACPALQDLAQGGAIRHWRDFLAAAELARPFLGISPSAWREAREAMGDQHAAITLAAILQRSDQINNAGGYLRSLADRARDGKFSTWPMIMALVRAKLDAGQPGNGGGGKRPAGDAGATSDLKVSPALLKTLKDPKFR